MPILPNARELQRDRKQSLRIVRATQRSADSAIERLERRIFTLLDRKTLITSEAAETLIPLWNDYQAKNRILERDLANFISTVNI